MWGRKRGSCGCREGGAMGARVGLSSLALGLRSARGFCTRGAEGFGGMWDWRCGNSMKVGGAATWQAFGRGFGSPARRGLFCAGRGGAHLLTRRVPFIWRLHGIGCAGGRFLRCWRLVRRRSSGGIGGWECWTWCRCRPGAG